MRQTVSSEAQAGHKDLSLRLMLRFADLPMPSRTAAAHGAVDVRLHLLGSPKLALANGRELALERKDAALLALLVLDGPTARAQAAAMVWPDVDDNRARNSLRQRLFRLRRATGRDVVIADSMLRLAGDIDHDLAALPQRLADDPDWGRGELLGLADYSDCEQLEQWVQVAREQWRATRRDALADAAYRLEQEGEIAAAIRFAERLIADDPLLEHAHRRLMRLHYLRGDRAAALTVYRRLSEVLQDELAAAPGTETAELAALIEGSGALPGTVRTSTPVAVLRPPRLIGRDTEQRQLDRAWNDERAVLLLGDPGIGKTRLLTDFAAERGGVLFGARPGDAHVPFSLLARILRGLQQRYGATHEPWIDLELARLVPEIGPPATQDFVTLRLQQAVVQALGTWARQGAALLAIDDLQFADDATVEMLPALVAAQTLPRWAFAARAGECPAAILVWAGAHGHHAPREIALAPLSTAAIEGLLASLAIAGLDSAAWTEPLARYTGGNPLYLLETLLTMLAQGPAALADRQRKPPAPVSVEQLIERRLDRLSAPALKLVRVAALAGQDFNAELAAHVLEQHPLDLARAWSELEAAQVIREQAFAHDLIQEVTARTVPAAIARVLHQRIARWLEEAAGAPARVAHHWLIAEQWRPAALCLSLAAEHALRTSRRAEELHLREQAALCFERAGDRGELLRTLDKITAACLVFGNVAGARAAAQRLRAGAQTDAERLVALNAYADVLNFAREHEAAADAAQQMLEIARRVGDARAAFNAGRKLTGAWASLGRFEQACALHDEYREWAGARPDDPDVHSYLSDRGYLYEQAGQPQEAIAAYRSAADVCLRHKNLSTAVFALTNSSVAHWRLGLADAALNLSDEALRWQSELGDAAGNVAIDVAQRGCILLDLGRLDAALAALHEAERELAAHGSAYWQMAASDHLALAYLVFGQPARAQPLLREMQEQAPAAAVAHRWVCRARLARSRDDGSRRGRPSELVVVLANLPDAVPFRIRALADLERAAMLDPEAGARIAGETVAEAERRQALGLALHALARSAECHLACGAVERAAAAARRCIAMAAQRVPFGMYVPELWWIAYRVLSAAHHAREAEAALRSGADWITQRAVSHVPEEFRDSFSHRNPVNRSLLTTAQRVLLG